MTPTFYRAPCGRYRSFLSQSDADAYTDGYHDHPRFLRELAGPYADGYFDREAEAIERQDREFDAFVAANDWGDE